MDLFDKNPDLMINAQKTMQKLEHKYAKDLKAAKGNQALIDNMLAALTAMGQEQAAVGQISITVDEDVLERVRSLAEADERSLSQYINLVLKQYLRSRDGTA